MTAIVAGVGARTPVGLNAVETGFFHRAATPAMRQAPFADDEGEPITMCWVPVLEPTLTGAERAAVLALPALEEALGGLAAALAELEVRLVVCLDEHMTGFRPDGVAPGAAATAPVVRRLTELGVRAHTDVLARGAAAAGIALQQHLASFARGALDALILGGIHTDWEPARIAALARAGRLFSPDRLDALIPGEAAAFAVLLRADVARRLGVDARATLLAAATGMDRARPDNDEPAFEAVGMTAAVRAVGGALEAAGRKVGWVLTDATFETMRLHELSAVTTRTQRLFCEPQQQDSPAQRMGFLGAAAGPLHLVLAAEGWRRGWAPHSVALSLTGSDTGERAALALHAAS